MDFIRKGDISYRLSGMMLHTKEGMMSRPLGRNGGSAFRNGKITSERIEAVE